VPISRVEDDSESRAGAIAALTLAFVRDPIMRWFYPEAQAYLKHFPGFARAFGGAAFASGTAWIADDDGGASLWLPPDVHADGEAIGGHAFSTVRDAERETLESIFGQLDAHHPKEPHWYLAMIGVDAAHQGKGLGALLLQVALERCDQDGVIAYLESSNPANISLYRRHGFEVVGEIRVGDCPPAFPMLRPARA
jgi:ribosomal protein S18 acetylase RimI-like enzyme